jgi:hypothetical protein
MSLQQVSTRFPPRKLAVVLIPLHVHDKRIVCHNLPLYEQSRLVFP